MIEYLGVIFALIYLYFSIRQKIWLWPFGILTSAFYIIVFFRSRLYADMGLQVYYLIISIYGWYYWFNGGQPGKKDSLPVSKVTLRQGVWLAVVAFGIYWVLVWTLKTIPAWLDIPASQLIYWDAFTTSASIVATWMLARKMIEQWWIWVVVDATSMILYIYKGLLPTAGLFLVYSGLAVAGYYAWKKNISSTEKSGVVSGKG
ncbi:MAG: nicotinamide mononucleotide transporter [Chlorobi bacterium]|nr:nicotinamide mononucleotide transporter [Chlorobiota bacterium]